MGNYSYKKLLGLIKENGLTQDELAEKVGISAATLSAKLNNKGLFKQSEIASITSALGINGSDIGLYFFTHEV